MSITRDPFQPKIPRPYAANIGFAHPSLAALRYPRWSTRFSATTTSRSPAAATDKAGHISQQRRTKQLHRRGQDILNIRNYSLWYRAYLPTSNLQMHISSPSRCNQQTSTHAASPKHERTYVYKFLHSSLNSPVFVQTTLFGDHQR